MPIYFILFSFLCVGIIGLFLPSDRILYLLEFILILNVPFIGIIFFKALFNNRINMDDMLVVASSVNHLPTYLSLCAATFTFSGYANMAIFNRVFKNKINTKFVWLFLVIGFTNFITTVFVPIGQLGYNAVAHYSFVWIVTSDTLRMQYGFVERVLYVFLLMYTGVIIIHVMIHWHVSIEMAKSLFQFRLSKDETEGNRIAIKKNKWKIAAILLIYMGTTMLLQYFQGDYETLVTIEYWLLIRFPAELFLLILVVIAAKRSLKHDST